MLVVDCRIEVLRLLAGRIQTYPVEALTRDARAKERKMQFAYAVDPGSELAKAFGATRTPEAFLFDANGKLVYHGTIDDNADDAKAVEQPYLANAVNAVALGKTVAVAETKALGCGIKFRGAKAS